MKKRIAFALLISLCLPGSVLPLESHAVATGQPDPRKQEPAIVYQITSQGKVMKMATQMPLMHRASISPSGRYLYGERIGYGKNDRTTPFLYNMQTKKLTTLSGFAKWSPAQDLLYIKENGALVRVNPSDGKKTVLVPSVPQYPVLDFAVSPDEQYLAFSRKDEKAVDPKVNTHLYLQHLPTHKMKVNDRYAWEPEMLGGQEPFYWMPTSRKLFYRTQNSFKELDLPTGLKYTHKMTSFPSYSSDMKYRYMKTDKEEYLLDMQTGKKLILQKQPDLIIANHLDTISWSPVGHQFVAEAFLSGSGSVQDAYMMIRYYQEAPRYTYPFGEVGKSSFSPYMDSLDNVSVIGWAKDGKSFYVADLASVHHTHFSPDKLDEYYRILECKSEQK